MKKESLGPGLKFDNDKLRWDLLPLDVIEDAVKIITFGANKYSENNWQQLDGGLDRYFAAMMRHLVEYRKGNMVDDESGQSHLSHAITNLIFLMWIEKNKKQTK